MSFRIASFNIQKLTFLATFKASVGESKKDVDMIARIIRENQFDIIAIQEIYHAQALRELLDRLSSQFPVEEQLKRGAKDFGPSNMSSRTNDSCGYRTKHWEGRWAKPRSNYGDTIAEGYAFIWNRDRIKLVENNDGKAFEPRISDFRGSDQLVRPPFVGRFMPINGSYEFRLINTHIVYGKPAKSIVNEDDEDVLSDYSDVEMRQREFEILAKQIYLSFNDQIVDPTRHDLNAKYRPAYTFLLGDYNLNLVGGTTRHARLSLENQAIVMQGRDPMLLVTVNGHLTTLKSSSPVLEPQGPQSETQYMANNYDHFTYDTIKFASHQIAQPSVNCLYAFNYYQDEETETKYDKYRKKVSDHIPIFIDFDIRKRA